MPRVRVLLRIALLSVGLVAIVTSVVGCREATSFAGISPTAQANAALTASATPTTPPTPTGVLHLATTTKKTGGAGSGDSSGQTNWLYVAILYSTCTPKVHPYPDIYLKNTNPNRANELFWQAQTNNGDVTLGGESGLDGGASEEADEIGFFGPYGPVTLTIYTIQMYQYPLYGYWKGTWPPCP